MQLIVAVAAAGGEKDAIADHDWARQPAAGEFGLPLERLRVVQLRRQIRLFAHSRTIVAAELPPVFGAGGVRKENRAENES
jgi:hypothetical protein